MSDETEKTDPKEQSDAGPPAVQKPPAPLATGKFTEEQVAAYNAVVGKAQLRNLALVDCKFQVKPRYFVEMTGKGSKVEHTFYDEAHDVSYDQGKGVAQVRIEWQLQAGVDEEPLLGLTASFIVVYVNLSDCDQDGVEFFLRRVGRFACFPYFRNLASQMSWLSQADLPMLPVLREGRDGHPRGKKRPFPEKNPDESVT